MAHAMPPLVSSLNISAIDEQDELTDLQNDSTAKDLSDAKTVEAFWIQYDLSSPNVAKVALRSLLCFVSTYI